MNKTLITLTAAAALAAGALAASPLAAAPIAAKQLGYAQHADNLIQQVRHDRRRAHRHAHRPHHRFARRHFWAPGPWAFRGHHNCFPVRGGFVCYF